MSDSPTHTPSTSGQPRTLLLATDNTNSILAELAGHRPNPIAYSAYGGRSAHQEVATALGFNGALREKHIGWYLLGNGYRAYNPTLMRFHSPDSWSPFGGGGLNAYMYCVGDPVNFSDPTGHMKSFFKAFTRSASSNPTRASSSSSLSPLIPEAAQTSTHTPAAKVIGPNQMGTSNPTFTHTDPIHEYENITGMTPRDVIPNNPIVSGPGNNVPPPIPPKRKPRFNDSGGQAGIISPNWKPDEPRRYRVLWNSEPFEHPVAPVPPTRTLPDGTSRHYSVAYDANGNPRQNSLKKFSLSLISEGIRN